MKRKVTFKMFLAVLLGGIWQVICWVASMFGYNDQTKYGKVVRRAFAGSCAVVALCFAAVLVYAAYEAISENMRRRYFCEHELSEICLSPNISLMQNYYSWEHSYLLDVSTGKKLLKGKVAWVVRSADGDSLAVYCDGQKRGYLNRYTGEVAIPAEYERAWVFSCDLACVQKDGSVFFIDHSGTRVGSMTFKVPADRDAGYVFKEDYCAVETEEDGWGMINKRGEWEKEPGYTDIKWKESYWVYTIKDTDSGVWNAILGNALHPLYTDICIADGYIYASCKDGYRRKFDSNGDVVDDFIVTDVSDLRYMTDERDDDGDWDYKDSNCKLYRIGYGKVGLLSLDGRPLTPAIYTDIDAINKDRFKCDLSNQECVILDDKGHQIK